MMSRVSVERVEHGEALVDNVWQVDLQFCGNPSDYDDAQANVYVPSIKLGSSGNPPVPNALQNPIWLLMMLLSAFDEP